MKNIHSNQEDKFLGEDDQYHPIYGLSRIFENENFSKTPAFEGPGRNSHILNYSAQEAQNAVRPLLLLQHPLPLPWKYSN
jgi:hypothetical protein